jgi:hypothetical protein
MDTNITSAIITGIFGLAAAVMTVWLTKRPATVREIKSMEIPDIPKKSTTQSSALSLDDILDRLDQNKQRATYGAVAGLLGRDPFTLFDGYPFTPRNSWVVAKRNGLPTNYPANQVHPELERFDRIISDKRELREWLNAN